MDYKKLKEEPLKSAVREDFFGKYKYTQIGNIDFVIAKHNTKQGQRSLFEDLDVSPSAQHDRHSGGAKATEESLKSILWAEAKQGTTHDIYESFVQLILTIGKERTFEKYLPPKYIGAFDAEKFAFIEYHEIQAIFYQNDFNWNVAPSNHDSKEFKQLHDLCENLLTENSIFFRYETQSAELREFIKLNFKTDKDISEKISVTKNNFTFVFQKWSEAVKPTISVDWNKLNRTGIISADFFLADLLSSDNESIKENLLVVLKKNKYLINKEIDEMLGLPTTLPVSFTDGKKAHSQFWAIYERPPKEEYWDYMIKRHDLLVPQDIRERKGSYFTPKIWVEKSQQYIADVLGENWQDEYFIWDCCAGTGNLVNGLTNYRNVWASTIDKSDVDIMKDRIANGWTMFENHVFQFDFLNDEFSKCPEELQEILNDEEKRKKLVIYINPPYAEAGSGMGKTKSGVAIENKTYEKYKDLIGKASNEIYTQIFIRIYKEINGCVLGTFSTLTLLTGANFAIFREVFRASLEKAFAVPAKTFDNVSGEFPIGFFVWNTKECHTDSILLTQNQEENCHSERSEESTEQRDVLLSLNMTNSQNGDSVGISNPCGNTLDLFDSNGNFLYEKRFFAHRKFDKFINDWLRNFYDKESKPIGIMHNNKNDFQHNSQVCITSDDNKDHTTPITKNNLIPMCIYYANRHCISHTWINHNDQFLYPNDGWQTDFEFQGDCLIYTLFGDKNRISANGVSVGNSNPCGNHFIPFTESQVGCKKAFKSTFMSDFLRDFLNGKVKIENGKTEGDLFAEKECHTDSELLRNSNESVELSSNGVSVGNSNPRGNFLSPEAQAVYDSGLELWKYYHTQPRANPDASFYDIRRFFQGETRGRMNNDSDDERYTELIGDLRKKMKMLAKRIEADVYRYGFLK